MLEIQDLHVRFHSRNREAVSGVSLTIENGEILGLVGESGSGKSVTAMSVAGLLPRKQCSYSGQILLDGTPGEVFAHADTLRTAGLDVPQCTAAVQYLQARGVRIRGDLNTPEQCAAALLDAWRTRGGAGRTQAGK